MTFQALMREAIDRFREASIDDTPALDAQVLLAAAFTVTKEQLFARFHDEPLAGGTASAPDAVDRFRNFVARRIAGEPIAYIIGRREFYGRDFVVAPGVLIPRPDSETLVTAVLETIDAIVKQPPGKPVGEPLQIHDICTGSGCIAVSIALERPGLCVGASDIDEQALRIAADNARRLAATVTFFAADVFRPLSTSLPHPGTHPNQRYDIITANPPYLRDSELAEPSIAFEPTHALAAGSDGLDIVRRVLTDAVECLRPNGYLFLETADHQHDQVVFLAAQAGWHRHVVYRDLADRRRVHRFQSVIES